MASGQQKLGASLLGFFFMFINVFTLLAMAPVAALTERMGKKPALLLMLMMSAVAYGSCWFTLGNSPAAFWHIPLPWGAADNELLVQWPCLITSLMIGVFTNTIPMIQNSMIADICDLDELRSGHRREAFFGAVFVTTDKLAIAVALAFQGFLLVASGFNSKLEQQTVETIHYWLVALITTQPLGCLVGLVAILFYPLTRARCHQIREELDARKKATGAGMSNDEAKSDERAPALDRAAIDRRFLDPALPPEQRAAILVAQMTLREKIAQMLHHAPPIPRLDVPAYNWWNECLHGVGRAGRATVFPQAIGLAATFNVPLMGRIATVISDEARAKHHQALRQGNRGMYVGLTYWSPNINIFRDPRWGRGQETYGECPYLTARMGVAFVQGLAGRSPALSRSWSPRPSTSRCTAGRSRCATGSTRWSARATCGKPTCRRSRPACRRRGAWSVMPAYNRTNGEPCCGSATLLREILREEWGFPRLRGQRLLGDQGFPREPPRHRHRRGIGGAGRQERLRPELRRHLSAPVRGGAAGVGQRGGNHAVGASACSPRASSSGMFDPEEHRAVGETAAGNRQLRRSTAGWPAAPRANRSCCSRTKAGCCRSARTSTRSWWSARSPARWMFC